MSSAPILDNKDPRAPSVCEPTALPPTVLAEAGEMIEIGHF